jgi:hypothetical protein
MLQAHLEQHGKLPPPENTSHINTIVPAMEPQSAQKRKAESAPDGERPSVRSWAGTDIGEVSAGIQLQTELYGAMRREDSEDQFMDAEEEVLQDPPQHEFNNAATQIVEGAEQGNDQNHEFNSGEDVGHAPVPSVRPHESSEGMSAGAIEAEEFRAENFEAGDYMTEPTGEHQQQADDGGYVQENNLPTNVPQLLDQAFTMTEYPLFGSSLTADDSHYPLSELAPGKREEEMAEINQATAFPDAAPDQTWSFDTFPSAEAEQDSKPNAEQLQEDEQPETPDPEDLFASTFGQKVTNTHNDDDDDDDEEDDEETNLRPTKQAQSSTTIAATLKSQGYEYHDSPTRVATPPPPSKSSQTTPPTAGTISTTRIANLNTVAHAGAAAVVPRDLDGGLRAYRRFHDRAMYLIPRLPNWNSIDWTRRYWVAVALMEKKPDNAKQEKDFMWMKANRFTTVRTVWHNFQLRALCDPDDFVLVCRGEVCGLDDR